MNIREAEIHDLELLSMLFDGYRVFYRKESDVDAVKGFLKERLENKDSTIFVCETEDSKLVGFTQLYPLFSSTRMKKLWLLNDLFVDNGYRGKGISVLLIDRAKQLVRDTHACGMFLETEKTNFIGNKLYPKTGFTFNEETNFYSWNVDK